MILIKHYTVYYENYFSFQIKDLEIFMLHSICIYIGIFVYMCLIEFIYNILCTCVYLSASVDVNT